MEPSTGLESLLGQMDRVTRASLSLTTSVATENIGGAIRGAIKGPGKIIRCMEVENSRGLMAVSM